MFLGAPSGGFKVVYEYANRLQARGHQVHVIHPRNIAPQPGVMELVKSIAWKWKLRIKHRPLVGWIRLDPRVGLRLAPDLRERFIPDGDAIVATALETAFSVSAYAAEKGRKFYLLQSYEDWSGKAGRVRESWRLPLRKIVISKWLRRIADEMGEAAAYIPIGLDFSHFAIATPIERRAPRVAMLAHPNEIKGLADGLAALEIARRERPGLQAVLFGTHPRASLLPDCPDWIDYVCRPAPAALVALYNSCQVYLHPSRREGWGLTAAEAMACGCALVSADNGGVHEFATEGESALLAPVQSPELLARQLIRVLADDSLRYRLARNGNAQVRQFTWDRAVDSLEQLLMEKSN